MKKMLLLVVLVLMLSTIWAESVILNDGRILEGEIVGKKGDSIYLSSKGYTYLLSRDIVNQIKNNGNLTITKITYKKKDFMKNGVDITQLTPLGKLENAIIYDKPLVKKELNVLMPAKLTKQNINEMNEREFQLYLTQLQVNEMTEIRKTHWKVWGASIGVSVAISAIILLTAGK